MTNCIEPNDFKPNGKKPTDHLPISGIRDPKICQKLLLMDEIATLENVITKAMQVEWSVSEQSLMTGTSGSDSDTIGIKQSYKASVSHQRIINDKHNRNENTAGRINDMLVKKTALYSEKGAMTAERTTILQLCVNRKKSPGSGKIGALEVDYDSLNTLTGCISGHSQVAKMVDATIDGCNITWLVDSGSPYTMISEKRAKSISLSWNKVTTDDKLQSATGSMLSEVGLRKCRMPFPGHSFDIEVRVFLNLEFDALLGRDSLTQFNEVTLKTGGKGPSLVLSLQQSKTKVENIVKEYAECFDKPLKNSQLKIEPEPIIDLTNDTVPIRCPTRRFSDADRKGIHETVTSLMKNGIIEESTYENGEVNQLSSVNAAVVNGWPSTSVAPQTSLIILMLFLFR